MKSIPTVTTTRAFCICAGIYDA